MSEPLGCIAEGAGLKVARHRITWQAVSDGPAMDLPLSRAVLADALGMTPVHINRVLQELRRSGAIELRRGVLRIADAATLTQISGFDANHLHKRLQ